VVSGKLLQLQWSADNKNPIYVVRVSPFVRISHCSPIADKTAVNSQTSAYTSKIWIQCLVVIALEQIWRAAEIDARRWRAPHDCYSHIYKMHSYMYTWLLKVLTHPPDVVSPSSRFVFGGQRKKTRKKTNTTVLTTSPPLTANASSE